MSLHQENSLCNPPEYANLDYNRIPLPPEPPHAVAVAPGLYRSAPVWDEYEGPLVLSAISQQEYEKVVSKKPLAFLVYPNTVKIVRDPKIQGKPPKSKRGSIDAFSDKSRRRLRRAAVDAWPALTSQFVLTYPSEFPKEGKESKKHLNAFLVAFRRKFKGHPYLWLLEFQRRGAPHYHLFLDLPVTEDARLWIAKTWVRIACNGDKKALAFHSDERNFIPWDMGNGAYVAKYLQKANQKHVPDGYTDVGRFWGSSRGLIPKPLYLQAEGMMEGYRGKIEKPVTRAVRVLARYHQQITTRWGHEHQKVVPVWSTGINEQGKKIAIRTTKIEGEKSGGPKRLGKSYVKSARSIFSFQVINGKKIYSEILKWYERKEKGRNTFKEWAKKNP